MKGVQINVTSQNEGRNPMPSFKAVVAKMTKMITAKCLEDELVLTLKISLIVFPSHSQSTLIQSQKFARSVFLIILAKNFAIGSDAKIRFSVFRLSHESTISNKTI